MKTVKQFDSTVVSLRSTCRSRKCDEFDSKNIFIVAESFKRLFSSISNICCAAFIIFSPRDFTFFCVCCFPTFRDFLSFFSSLCAHGNIVPSSCALFQSQRWTRKARNCLLVYRIEARAKGKSFNKEILDHKLPLFIKGLRRISWGSETFNFCFEWYFSVNIQLFPESSFSSASCFFVNLMKNRFDLNKAKLQMSRRFMRGKSKAKLKFYRVGEERRKESTWWCCGWMRGNVEWKMEQCSSTSDIFRFSLFLLLKGNNDNGSAEIKMRDFSNKVNADWRRCRSFHFKPHLMEIRRHWLTVWGGTFTSLFSTSVLKLIRRKFPND